MLIRIAASFLLVFSLINLVACTSNTPKYYVVSGPTMGTTYNIKFMLSETSAERTSPHELRNDVDDLLVDINNLMSTYISESELSKLNDAPAGVPFRISAETQYVLSEAIKIGQLSNGMLDVTVGPVVNLWGFGPTKRPDKVPSQEKLNMIAPYVGLDKFKINNGNVVKSHPEVYIDLSTIAKGYAVDRVAELIESKGIRNYLVEIGGEMRVSGKKAGEKDWLIAVEKPVTNERAIQRVFSIGDNAVATSGDYRNYYEHDGIRYSHLIDPNTFSPIQHKVVSVTVVDKLSLRADGWSTALIVMGMEKGFALAEELELAALFIVKDGDEFIEYPTSKFTERVTPLARNNES
ncbi:FAD:protein FMN transferase [Agaribacter marinus]